MIPVIHFKPKKVKHGRWADHFYNRCKSYSFALKMWMEHKRRIAKKVPNQTLLRTWFVREMKLLEKAVNEAVTLCKGMEKK